MTKNSLHKIKNKYKGEVAKNYEISRKDTEHWRREQRIVETLLDTSGIGDGSTILDIPVGTGRFFSLYKSRGYRVLGLDASPDMLNEAENKAEEVGYSDVDLKIGDITRIALEDKSIDLAVCIRLMNWFDFRDFQRALNELVRVSSQYIILGVRVSAGWRRIGFDAWLKQVVKAWKQDLRVFAGRVRRSLQRQFLDGHASESASSGPPLVDHPEADIRSVFQEQGLTVVREERAMLFTDEPRLSGLGAIQELPYHIFLLRV